MTSARPSASTSSRVTYYYRTKFVAHGELVGRDYRCAVKVALPADDWCCGLFQVTPLSAFGRSAIRHFSRHDIVPLYIAGCNVNARVASKGHNGEIWIFAQEVFRALARPALVNEDFGDRKTRAAKRKKAPRNG